MIGKKLLLTNNSEIGYIEEISIETIDLDKVRNGTVRHAKKYGFLMLVTILRISIRSSHLIKEGYKEARHKTKLFINKISSKKSIQKEKEVSSFLRMVSDYKGKIREITDKIKEEEGIE